MKSKAFIFRHTDSCREHQRHINMDHAIRGGDFITLPDDQPVLFQDFCICIDKDY